MAGYLFLFSSFLLPLLFIIHNFKYYGIEGFIFSLSSIVFIISFIFLIIINNRKKMTDNEKNKNQQTFENTIVVLIISFLTTWGTWPYKNHSQSTTNNNYQKKYSTHEENSTKLLVDNYLKQINNQSTVSQNNYNDNPTKETPLTPLQIIELKAQQNDYESQIKLGNALFHGEGVNIDKNKALKWYQLAANHDFATPEFQYSYAVTLWNISINDYKHEIIDMLNKASNKNYTPAQYLLARIKINSPLEYDRIEGMNLLKKTADNNYMDSKNILLSIISNSFKDVIVIKSIYSMDNNLFARITFNKSQIFIIGKNDILPNGYKIKEISFDYIIISKNEYGQLIQYKIQLII